MNKATVAISIALAAGSLLAAGWWLGQRHLPAAAELGSSPSRAALDAAAGGPRDLALDPQITAPSGLDAPSGGSAAGAGTLPEPLPAADMPIDEIFDALAERAAKGDARAACRLVVELQRCRSAGFFGRGTRGLERRAIREEDGARREAMISQLARLEHERERSHTVCSGLSSEQLDRAFAYQQQAAQALPSLRTWAATHPALSIPNFVNELDAWQQYRRVALPWLESAALQGDYTALVALARAHAEREPHRMNLPPLSEPDVERFALYAGLLERRGLHIGLLQAELARARAGLEPAALGRVEREIDRLAATLPDTPPPQGPALGRAISGILPPDSSACE